MVEQAKVAPMTVEAFWAEYEGQRFELVEGVPKAMSPTGQQHDIVCMNVSYDLFRHVKEHSLGVVTSAESGFYLKPGLLRAPDVGFVSKERYKGVTQKYTPYPPDLAVEVVSPGDSAADIHRKVTDYLEAGTRLVWVVYPDSRQVTVHRPGGTAQILGEADALGGEDVVQGLKVPVSALFEV